MTVKRQQGRKRDEEIRAAFGGLFFAAHHLEVFLDRYLAPHGLTTKQFFLSFVLLEHGDQAPALTLSHAAALMGTSRQNVKQLALRLEAKGFCTITPDTRDRRIQRLAITQANIDFWKRHDEENAALLRRLYADIDDATLGSMADGLSKLFNAVKGMAEGAAGQPPSPEKSSQREAALPNW